MRYFLNTKYSTWQKGMPGESVQLGPWSDFSANKIGDQEGNILWILFFYPKKYKNKSDSVVLPWGVGARCEVFITVFYSFIN